MVLFANSISAVQSTYLYMLIDCSLARRFYFHMFFLSLFYTIRLPPISGLFFPTIWIFPLKLSQFLIFLSLDFCTNSQETSLSHYNLTQNMFLFLPFINHKNFIHNNRQFIAFCFWLLFFYYYFVVPIQLLVNTL